MTSDEKRTGGDPADDALSGLADADRAELEYQLLQDRIARVRQELYAAEDAGDSARAQTLRVTLQELLDRQSAM